jgi:type I restriction enzyme S subunit
MAGEWSDKPLGQVATLQRGFDLPVQKRQPGRVPIVSSSGISDYHAESAVSGPGVVTGRYGTIGQVFLVTEDYWPLNTTLWVKDFHGNDPRFIFYLLKTLDFRSCSDKSSVPGVNRNDLHTLIVRLPPLPEQKRIAHILGTLDDKIELNRRMNATLEGISRALFKSWFVDFDPVRQKAAGQQPVGMDAETAALFPDSFEDSEIGEVPRGWGIASLESVLSEIETGGRPKGGVANYSAGIPSIGAESIVGLGHFDYSKTKYVPVDFYDRMTRGKVRSRDVLLYKDGGRPGEFEPHVTLFGDGFPFAKCAINEHVYRMRANEDFGQSLLLFWLGSDLVMDEMRVKGTGVAIPGLNSTQAKSLTTLLPPPQITTAFDRRVEPYVARILAACNQSRTLATLRDTLLPKLLSGEIRVPAAEAAVEEAVG